MAYSHDGLAYMWTAHGANIAAALGIGDLEEGDAFDTSHACGLLAMDISFGDAVDEGLIILSLFTWTALGAGISPALLGCEVAPGDEVTAQHFALLMRVGMSKDEALEHDIIIAAVQM